MWDTDHDSKSACGPCAETRDRTFSKEQSAGLELAKSILLAGKGHVPTCAELQCTQFFTEKLPPAAVGMATAAAAKPVSEQRTSGVRKLHAHLEQL